MHHLQHIAELASTLRGIGATQVVLAPGSRNAPLSQLFTSLDHFNCHSIVDERSAGYVALGMARQSGELVVVVVTSGTAVLNLSPAVAEAFHQQLPLLVLTADRPREKVPQFNNQVCDQQAPYFNHSKGFFEFPAEVRTKEDLQRDLHAVEDLLKVAMQGPMGPVHVNLPLCEPLYVPLPRPLLPPVRDVDAARENPDTGLSSFAGSLLAHKDLSGLKILILAGMGTGTEELRRDMEQLVGRGQVLVVAENISNLHSPAFISVPELVLSGATREEEQELVPDVVIAFGLQMVSKRMKLFVNSLEKSEILLIPGGASVREWMNSLAGNLETEVENHYQNHYQKTWHSLEERECLRASNYLEKAPYCNLTAVHKILGKVPEGTVVHLGNSATIRNAQLLRARSGLTYYSNRGTSGIDGCVSTAVGAAMVSDTPHLLLVGDLSFVYDSNALWNKDFPENLKIIVMNDGGGGIFRLLDGADTMKFFEEFSVTHHPVSLEMLAQSYGRTYMRVKDLEGLDEQLKVFFSEGMPLSVLEVDTTSAENSRIFKDLFR